MVPHGICLGHIACSLGEKENEVRQVLEKQVQEKSYQPSSSNVCGLHTGHVHRLTQYTHTIQLDDTIMCGIQALQKSLGANDNNLTAADLEICVWRRRVCGCTPDTHTDTRTHTHIPLSTRRL